MSSYEQERLKQLFDELLNANDAARIQALMDNFAPIDESLFESSKEQNFYDELKYSEQINKKLLEQNKYLEIMKQCASMNDVLNDFLDNVFINCENEAVAKNRKNMLRRYAAQTNLVLDYKKLSSG